MPLFHPANRTRSPRHERIWAVYEMAYTAVDFTAAICFIVGSVLFFWEATQTSATWLFLVGSVCFALKPTLRLAREIKYMSIGDYEDVAGRAKG